MQGSVYVKIALAKRNLFTVYLGKIRDLRALKNENVCKTCEIMYFLAYIKVQPMLVVYSRYFVDVQFFVP